MRNAVFVDTSAFMAHADTLDQRHAEARELEPRVSQAGRLATSLLVLTETCLFLHRRLGYAACQSFWDSILSGGAGIELLYPDNKDLERAYQISQKYADQGFSFVDCTSFAMMERLKISQAYSFDQDFLVFQLPSGPIRRIP